MRRKNKKTPVRGVRPTKKHSVGAWAGGTQVELRLWGEALLHGAQEVTGDMGWELMEPFRGASAAEEGYGEDSVHLFIEEEVFLDIILTYPRDFLCPEKMLPSEEAPIRRSVSLAVFINTQAPEDQRLLADERFVRLRGERNAAIQQLSNPTHIMRAIAKGLRAAMEENSWRDVDDQAYQHRQKTVDVFNPKANGEPVSFSRHELGPKVKKGTVGGKKRRVGILAKQKVTTIGAWAGEQGDAWRWSHALCQGLREITGEKGWDVREAELDMPEMSDDPDVCVDFVELMGPGGADEADRVVVTLSSPYRHLLPFKPVPGRIDPMRWVVLRVLFAMPEDDEVLFEKEKVVRYQGDLDAIIQDYSNPSYIMHAIAKPLRAALDLDRPGQQADSNALAHRLKTTDRFNPKTSTGDPQSFSSHEWGSKVKSKISGKKKDRVGAFVEPFSTLTGDMAAKIEEGLMLLPYQARFLLGLDCAEKALPLYEAQTGRKRLGELLRYVRTRVLGEKNPTQDRAAEDDAAVLVREQSRTYEGDNQRRAWLAAKSAENAVTLQSDSKAYYTVQAVWYAIEAVREASPHGMDWVRKLFNRYLGRALDEAMSWASELPPLEGDPTDVTQGTIVRAQAYEKLREMSPEISKMTPAIRKKFEWTANQFQEVTGAFEWADHLERTLRPRVIGKWPTPLHELCSRRFKEVGTILQAWEKARIPKEKLGQAKQSVVGAKNLKYIPLDHGVVDGPFHKFLIPLREIEQFVGEFVAFFNAESEKPKYKSSYGTLDWDGISAATFAARPGFARKANTLIEAVIQAAFPLCDELEFDGTGKTILAKIRKDFVFLRDKFVGVKPKYAGFYTYTHEQLLDKVKRGDQILRSPNVTYQDLYAWLGNLGNVLARSYYKVHPNMEVGWAEPPSGGEGDDGEGTDRKIRELLASLLPKEQQRWAIDCLQHILPEFKRHFPKKDYLEKIINLRKDFVAGTITFHTMMMAAPNLFPFPMSESQTLLWAFYAAAMSADPYETSKHAAEAMEAAQDLGLAYGTERQWQFHRLNKYQSGEIGAKRSFPATPWPGILPKVGQMVRTACPKSQEAAVCRNWSARMPETALVVWASQDKVFLEGCPQPFTRRKNGAFVLEGYTLTTGPYLEKLAASVSGKRKKTAQIQRVSGESKKAPTFLLAMLPNDMRQELFNLHANGVNPGATRKGFALLRVPTGQMNITKIQLENIPAKQLARFVVPDFSVLPPIVIADGRLVDGAHRVTAAQQKGLTHLKYIDMTGLLNTELTGYITDV